MPDLNQNTPDQIIYEYRKFWGGMYSHQALQQILTLQDIGVGHLRKSHYIVKFRPFWEKGQVATLTKANQLPLLDQSYMGWLVTSADLSLIDAQTDSVQAGHYQHNYVTGNNANEITLTMLETKNGDVLNSADIIKNIMFAKDGTQTVPADYMFYVSIGIFDWSNREKVVFQKEQLVCLQSARVDLAAGNKEVLDVQMIFTKMYPMLPIRGSF